MKHCITLFLACSLFILSLSGCGLIKDYSMSPTDGDGFYEFNKSEIGIYFTYNREAASGIMTAENQTGFRTSIRIQRKYEENDEWGRGIGFTLGSQEKYSYSEYYPKGTPLRITIKRDGQEWVLRVDLD